jgi:hypothetical protein
VLLGDALGAAHLADERTLRLELLDELAHVHDTSPRI